MFFKRTNEHLAKLEILESKLSMFESMSKEMMKTLNDAVSKISEANQNIAKCLVAHDERLKTNSLNHERTLDHLEKLEDQNRIEHRKLIEKIEASEHTLKNTIDTNNDNVVNKLAENEKFKARLIGIGLMITFIATISVALIPIISNGFDLYVNSQSIEMLERHINEREKANQKSTQN